ncbi:MAG: hypothetical protein KKA59_00840 [Candidatus Omnitrophica bacterium]|nr:hypothetical protein [Candidatus Omnitrophota bacterium]
MKRLFTILGLILAIHLLYGTVPLCAGEGEPSSSNVTQEKDSVAIKKAVETYLQCFVGRDINSMMDQVSKNYTIKSDNSVTTYDEFRADIESQLERMIDISISDLNIEEPNISNDKASIQVKFNFKAQNLNTLSYINEVRRMRFFFIKEG